MRLYGFKDIVKERFDMLTLAYTDKDAVRRFLIMNGGQKPICDIEIYEVAEAIEETGEIRPIEHRKVDKSCYCLPDNKEEEMKEFNPERPKAE